MRTRRLAPTQSRSVKTKKPRLSAGPVFIALQSLAVLLAALSALAALALTVLLATLLLLAGLLLPATLLLTTLLLTTLLLTTLLAALLLLTRLLVRTLILVLVFVLRHFSTSFQRSLAWRLEDPLRDLPAYKNNAF
jgi:hypothetical protein